MLKLLTLSINGTEITEVMHEYPNGARGEVVRKRAVTAKRGSYSNGVTLFGDRRMGPDKLTLTFPIGAFDDADYKAQADALLRVLESEPIWLVEGDRRLELMLADGITEKPLVAHVSSVGSLAVDMFVQGNWESMTELEVVETLTAGDNDLTFTNNGSLLTYPVIDVDAGGVTEVIIIADGRTFTWQDDAGILPANVLRINTRAGLVSRGGAENEDISSKVVDGSQMPTFPPGVTNYQVSLTGGGGTMTIKYREAFY